MLVAKTWVPVDIIYQSACLRVKEADDRNTMHHRICSELCDIYELWEDGDKIPMWLMYIVGGIMSDEGKS